MFETVQKVVDHWLFKVVTRGAMVDTLAVLGYAAGLINNVSSRTTALETTTAQIRLDVDTIDQRAIERAELSDNRAEDTLVFQTDMREDMTKVREDVATIKGVIQALLRSQVASNASAFIEDAVP